MFPVLRERQKQRAGTLSGGEQQMVAIGRTMMSRPKLLLLDEPSLGLAPLVANGIFQTIRVLRDRGTTILLVEQNAKAALKVADRGYVLETGRIILEGETEDLLNNKEVQRAYLGKEYREVWE
jgi:branched-chain amino acid transport system ATP-binding protein